MIDTHCHLTFPQYQGRVPVILADARAEGVRGAITVSTTTRDAVSALELARCHEGLWCTAGVHPLHSDEPADWDVLARCGRDPKCVAWGELGLDNHYENPPRDIQRSVLMNQLDCLQRCSTEGLNKPIVIHCRDAFDDLLAILKDAPFDRDRYVFHCFTGTAAEARKVLDFGAWISFTGVVTFKNAREVAEAARVVPADRIMVETDSPFLSPEPVRTARPNLPRYVVHVAGFLADLRGVNPIEFEHTLDDNTERFFGIRLPASIPNRVAAP